MELTWTSDSEPVALVAVDWGTSSCRAWTVGRDGTVRGEARSHRGMLAVAKQVPAADSGARARAFEEALWQLAGPVLERDPEVPVLLCGMVGSTLGWAEAGYLPVPTSIHIAASDLTRVAIRGGRSAWIVPGIRQADGPYPDVIRGEETQLIGVLERLDAAGSGQRARTIVLPGTHTKWVRVVGERVERFTTSMSGELFGLLMDHSILGEPAQRAGGFDRASFERGLRVAREAQHLGLAAEVFSARTLNMDGDVPDAGIGDYLSGLLIGDEVGRLLPQFAPGAHEGGGAVAVCGNARLTGQYCIALEAAGATVAPIGEDASVSGLWRIARDSGLVEGSAAGAAVRLPDRHAEEVSHE